MARGGVTGGTIRVEGLAELIRDFYRIDKQLSGDLRRELVEVGKIVADDAKNVQMPRQGLAAGQGGKDGRANSGTLQNSIRSKMRGQSTVIVEQRRNKKMRYAYGAIYEFDRGRAYLGPALDAKSSEVIEAIDDMFDRVVSANGFGTGGIL